MQFSITFHTLLASMVVAVSVSPRINAAPTGHAADLTTLLARDNIARASNAALPNVPAPAPAPIRLPLTPILNENKVEEAFTAAIHIGGNPRPFNVIMDTGSHELWAISEKSTEIAGRNAIGAISSKATFKELAGTFGVDFDDGSDVEGKQVTDDLNIGGKILKAFKFGAATKIGDSLDPKSDGIWGFSKSIGSAVNGPTPLEALAAAKIIPAAMSGWKIGRASEGTASEVVLGGVNPALFDSASTVVVSNVDVSTPDDKDGWWRVPVTAFAVGATNTPLAKGPRIATLDTGTEGLIFPRADTALIRAQIPGSRELKDGTNQIPCNNQKNLVVTIGNKPWNILAKDLITAPVNDKKTPGLCFASFVADEDPDFDEWVLGIPFLKNVYHALDVTNDRISISKLK
ncbi:acid protease [Dentipellis sp. KUC8613]|nr:acid protease [Dentipellis sp. KUC8613]